MLLFKDAGSAVQAIRSLACEKEYRRQRIKLINGLNSFLPLNSDDDRVEAVPSHTDLRAASVAPPECSREILTLHKTLSTYCLCDDPEETASEVVARIRLHSKAGDDEGTSFGVLFMAHPHRDGNAPETQPWWQDTFISVRRAVFVHLISHDGKYKC